jgi:hypothetical protein
MRNNSAVKAFLNAVNTWRHLVKALAVANKTSDTRRKSALMCSMFYWRKEAEKLKSLVDCLRVAV